MDKYIGVHGIYNMMMVKTPVDYQNGNVFSDEALLEFWSGRVNLDSHLRNHKSLFKICVSSHLHLPANPEPAIALGPNILDLDDNVHLAGVGVGTFEAALFGD
jgi:hypothetical protein